MVLVPVPVVMVRVLVVIWLRVSRVVVLVRVVVVLLLVVLMLRLMRILMVIVPVTVMSVMVQGHVVGIMLVVPGLLLRVVVPVLVLLIAVRLVPIHLALAGMLLVAVMLVVIRRMQREQIAGVSASPVMALETALTLPAEAIIRTSVLLLGMVVPEAALRPVRMVIVMVRALVTPAGDPLLLRRRISAAAGVRWPGYVMQHTAVPTRKTPTMRTVTAARLTGPRATATAAEAVIVPGQLSGTGTGAALHASV